MGNDTSKGSIWGRVMKYVLPLFFTVGLCYVLFHNIDFAEMMEIIRTQCDYRWIAAALVVSVFSHVFRAMRWNIQLQALGIHAPLRVLVLSVFGTYAVNLVLPRLGELWRSTYVAQRQDAPFASVFGSMVAERLADTVTVLLLTLLVFAVASRTLIGYLSQSQSTYDAAMALLTSPWLIFGMLLLVGLAVWFFTLHPKEGSAAWKVHRFFAGLWQGFAVIAKMPGKGRWLLYTFLLWGAYFTQMWLAFYAFPFTAEVAAHYGIVAVLVTFVFSSISMGVPSNGGIGPYQWAIIFALSIYGVDRTAASAFGNLVLGSQTALLIVLGIYTFIAITLDKKKNSPSKQIINK